MASGRIFTDEELADLSERTIDKARKAIKEGDTERALELVNLQYEQFAFLHDGYMTWVAGLQTFIYENYGIEALEAAERQAHEIEARFIFIPDDEPDFKKAVAGFINGMNGHVHQPMTVTEDDEKIVMTVGPCGSGGRLMDNGGYDEEIGLAKIKEPSNITFQLPDFPIYCIHCPVMQAQDFERCGDFTFVKGFKDGKIGSCCEYLFYKDKADIPEKYYTEIGKEKPVSK